jgi:hypothetical protein
MNQWHLEPHFGGDGYPFDGNLDEAIAEVKQRWRSRHQRWDIHEQPGGILLAEVRSSGSVVFRQELRGEEVKTLMRRYHKTILQLAFVMGITQKRIRAVRSAGLLDRNAVRDWLEAITGLDPGPLPERYRISRRDEEADCCDCAYPLGVGDEAYEYALGAFCSVTCCRAGYRRKMSAEAARCSTA